MSVNSHLPHVFVLPEDDANRQMAIGFRVGVGNTRQMYVLAPADGRSKVVDEFKEVHIAEMDRNSKRFMVLLIDCDGKPERLDKVRAEVPSNLADRVFVLGSRTNPEKLGVGDKERFGEKLAKDCRDGTSKAWGHELLQHNSAEVDRLRQIIRPILF